MASITEDTTPESLFSNWAEISNMFPMIYGEDRKKRENKKYALKSRLLKKQYKSDLLMYYRAISLMVERETLCNAENQRLRDELETFKNGSHASTMIDTSPVLMLEDKRAEPKHSVQLTTEYIELVEKEQQILKQNIRPDQKSFYEFYMNIYETRDTLEVKKFKRYVGMMKRKIEELKENKVFTDSVPAHYSRKGFLYQQLVEPESDIPSGNNMGNNVAVEDMNPESSDDGSGSDEPESGIPLGNNIGNNMGVEDMGPESSNDGSESDELIGNDEEQFDRIHDKWYTSKGYTYEPYHDDIDDFPKPGWYKLNKVGKTMRGREVYINGEYSKAFQKFWKDETKHTDL